MLGLKKCWVRKKFWVWKKSVTEKILGLKKILGWKNFWVSKIFWSENEFLVCSIIVDFGGVLLVALVLLVPWVNRTPTSPSDRFWCGVLLLFVVLIYSGFYWLITNITVINLNKDHHSQLWGLYVCMVFTVHWYVC